MLVRARIEDKQNHPATEKPPSTAGTLLRWRTRIGIAGVSSGTAVGAPPIHYLLWCAEATG